MGYVQCSLVWLFATNTAVILVIPCATVIQACIQGSERKVEQQPEYDNEQCQTC